MTKRMNLTHRKNARRISALGRLRKQLGYWFHVDGPSPNTTDQLRRIKEEIETLESRIT